MVARHPIPRDLDINQSSDILQHSQNRPTYKSNTVKIVTCYRYLGLTFSLRYTWSKALSTLASQAEKAFKFYMENDLEARAHKYNCNFQDFQQQNCSNFILWC